MGEKPQKRIRIEKHIDKGQDGRKRVVVIKRAGKGEWHDVGGATFETDIDVEAGDEVLDIDSLLEDIEEEDENGHTVIKIRIPKVDSGGESDPLVRAAGVSGAIENLEGEIGALVRRAREQGYSWTQIGQALGTSKQAAWERFSGEE